MASPTELMMLSFMHQIQVSNKLAIFVVNFCAFHCCFLLQVQQLQIDATLSNCQFDGWPKLSS